MKRKWIAYFAALLLLTFIRVPEAAPTITSISPSIGGAVNFTGDDTKFLRVTNSSNLNLGITDFTISWWQKTTSYQFMYPRIMQFGSGNSYTDKFAISEENDGNIYLWINGINITSMPIPSMFDWHHISITRDGSNYYWSLDGVKGGTTNFVSTIPCDGCLPKFADFDTSGLDLYLGAGNDPSTGAFLGDIAGFQISQSVRWPGSASFTPPTDFLNPTAGLAFSMYVNSTDLVDKSAQTLTITPVGISNADFSNFSPPLPEPDPSPSPSASPSPSPSPSASPSPSPSPSDSVSPSPSPSPSDPGPTITPDPITHEISVSVWQSQGGKITAETASWTESATTQAYQYEFSVVGDEAYGIHIFPERGYEISQILWNGEVRTDPSNWNGSQNTISGTELTENLTLSISFRLIRTRSMVISDPGNNHIFFRDTFYLTSENENIPNNYWGVGGIILALPVTVPGLNSEEIQTTCYMDMNPFWDMDPFTNFDEIQIQLPEFSAFLYFFFPQDCEFPEIAGFPEGYAIENYFPGMLSVESVTATLALFSNLPDDYSNLTTAVETKTLTITLPPDLLGYTVISQDPQKASPGKIYFGDTITVEVRNAATAHLLEMIVELPEATSTDPSNVERFCILEYAAREDHSYLFPTEGEFIARCRQAWDGDWELNRTQDHAIGVTYSDSAYNHGRTLSITLAAPVQVSIPTPPAPTAPSVSTYIPPAPTIEILPPEKSIVVIPEKELISNPKVESEEDVQESVQVEQVETLVIAEKKNVSIKKKACIARGVWIYTKSGLLQICDEKLNVVLATKACAGKSSTPTFPWVYKAQRFKAGYTPTKSGLSLFYSVFFFKGLAIAGVDRVSDAPCSKGSVLIDKISAKKVYKFLRTTNAPIWVKDR